MTVRYLAEDYAGSIADCEETLARNSHHFGALSGQGLCYMAQQGKLDEAIPWLEKAKLAKRYEPRQFPFMNPGRIYLRRGRWWEALREFEGAVQLAPGDVHASKMLHQLRGRLN